MISRQIETPVAVLALIGLMWLTPASASAQSEAADRRAETASGQLEEITLHVPRLLPRLSAESAARQPIEEITVRAQRSPAAYRIALQLAEERIFDVFNEINSRDDFDIYCTYERPTGSRIPRRVCRPNFVDDATAEYAQTYLRGLQRGEGNAGLGQAQVEASRAHYNQRLLAAEMQRLVGEDPRLYLAVREFESLQQDYREARERSRD